MCEKTGFMTKSQCSNSSVKCNIKQMKNKQNYIIQFMTYKGTQINEKRGKYTETYFLAMVP